MFGMYSLNENQAAAAAHLDGPMMVLAGPGSGKTSVITARCVGLAEKTDPGRILVITFSKAAAAEMKKRFGRAYSGQPPLVDFGTFHSVFFRMLRESKGYGLDGLVGEGEKRGVVKGFLGKLGYILDDDGLSAVISELSLLQNELLDPRHYHAKSMGSADFVALDGMYAEYKAAGGKIDFDDMLTHAYRMLRDEPDALEKWRRRYGYIMIDEFQDINRAQYEAVKLLAAPSNNIFVVGDDDQSIYRFRGSRPEFLLNFPKDFPDTAAVTLSTNYRSTDSIIAYANRLISANKARFEKNVSGTNRPGAKPFFLSAEDPNAEAAQIGERIRRMQKKGTVLDEIAVAFRLNIQARAFADTFLNMNIPFKSRDEIPSLYGHWIAEDVYAFLRLARRLAAKTSAGHCPDAERIVNKPFRYVGKAFLAWLREGDRDIFMEYARDKSLHMATKTGLEELHANLLLLSKLETADAIRFLRARMGYDRHLVDTSEYRKLNSIGLREIADELTEAAARFPDPMEFVAHAEASKAAAKAKPPEGSCCTLTTLHSAKGLEFENVFIAGVVEDLLPHMHSKSEAEIEEERRLFYVGATRAKNELYISVVKSRYDRPCRPSRFLGENVGGTQ